MKLFKKIGLFFVAALALSSCVDKDPDYQNFPSADVDFTYSVAGDQFALDYYVVSAIQFNNTSVKTGNVTWDFGDGNTSNEPNPIHKYAAAGSYNVTLTVEGAGSRTYPLMISDIVPIVTVANQSTDIITFNQTTVSFNVFLPNPEEKVVNYEWTFPEGTTDESGNDLSGVQKYVYANGAFTPALPVVKFSNIGSQRIDIASWYDVEGENRRLDNSFINVQVGLDTPAATLYYAQRDGNIKALKIVDPSTLPAGTKVFPYDMGVKSGNNPFNIVYAETTSENEEGGTEKIGWIYILDAGKQYYYIDDAAGNQGDGQITAMRTDGTNVNTVVTNVGQAAFSDPFQGFVHNGKLYYSDRNTGITELDLNTRGAVEEISQSGTTYLRKNFFVKNEWLPYYNKTISYGAISTGHYLDANGVWWWGKNYNGIGIFRFKQGDIYKDEDATTKPVPYSVVLSGTAIKAFTLDEERGKLYAWGTSSPEGFLEYPLPGSDATVGDKDLVKNIVMSADPVNTTTEGVYTTQFALDKESGRVYFGFRPAANETKYKSGVYFYDPVKQTVVSYGETNDQIFGITINPNKTQLY